MDGVHTNEALKKRVPTADINKKKSSRGFRTTASKPLYLKGSKGNIKRDLVKVVYSEGYVRPQISHFKLLL